MEKTFTKGPITMAEYQIADRGDTEQLRRFLAQDGQLLLPILALVESAEVALDEVIDVAGRATIEAILTLSARKLAGEKQPGKAAGEVRWASSAKSAILDLMNGPPGAKAIETQISQILAENSQHEQAGDEPSHFTTRLPTRLSTCLHHATLAST
jgi:hypothetical protein